MLTDRQQKFYNKITTLINNKSSLTEQEFKCLNATKVKLDQNESFKESINYLNRVLKTLDYGALQEGGLSPKVKELFEEIKEVYGEPVSSDIHANNLAKVPTAAKTYNQALLWLSGIILLALLFISYSSFSIFKTGIYKELFIGFALLIVMIVLILTGKKKRR